MNTLAVLFSGQGSNLAHILDRLHGKGYEVLVAITNNPKAGGISIAKCYNIPVEIIDSKAYDKREVFDAKLVETLHEYNPDLTVLAGFMRILTPVFTTQITAINLHPSLLPRHKGLHAIEKSYADAFSHGGVSIHYVDSTLDGGEIILQKKVPKEGLDFEDYYVQIRVLEKKALSQAIKKILKEKNETN
jgi:phosphoribosylglycinamide formyltransferase-1